MRERGDDQGETAADRERHAVEAQRVRTGRAQREDFLIGGQPAETELHAEHERQRNRGNEEVRSERGGDAEQILDGHGAGEDHLVELQELEDDQQLEDGEQPDAERDGDLPEQEAVQERHRRAL